ncbi:cytochrome P450 [Streptomyces ipomoeae]|uniref:cytochrome P450 n=1 Tax=Streptomyces ipomoeae TaxID=103232 RepID=UPI0011472473|nr:cytochrome P450 [Streptomyces ipomoeae]MDX2937765.1 cytochrome P450 [Streptomyces ipomoeae]TQE17228.1 cytochrome P450 [Streptomyces ipomoeae]
MSSSSTPMFAEVSEAFGAGLVDDPYPFFAQHRSKSPVREGDVMLELGAPSFAAMHRGPVFTFFKHKDVQTAFRDPVTYSSAIWLEGMEPLLGRSVLGLDGEEHRSWRGLLTQVFTRRALPLWEAELLKPIARQCVEELRLGGRRADLTGFAFQFPMRAIYQVIGFGDDPESYERFATSALTILLATAIDPAPEKAEEVQQAFARASKAANEAYELILGVVERTRAAGATGSGLISHLVNCEFEGRKLDDDEIAAFVRTLLLAATESTTRTFLNVATLLFTRPELLDEVRANPSRIDAVMREGERLESTSLALPRVTTRQVTVRDVSIPAGSAIVLCVGSANRDEEAFPQPDEFILDREGATPLTFGFGSHICPGMNIARLEMRAMFDALLTGLPGLRLDPEAKPPMIRGVNMRGPAALNVLWD